MPVLTSLEPVRVIEGGRLWLRGDGFPRPESTFDLVTIGGVSARMAFAAPDRMAVVVPSGLGGLTCTFRSYACIRVGGSCRTLISNDEVVRFQ